MAKRCRMCLHGDKWILGDAHILYQDFVLEMHFFYFWDTRILYQNFILEMHIFCIKILFWTLFFKKGTTSIPNILYIVLFRSMHIFCFKISTLMLYEIRLACVRTNSKFLTNTAIETLQAGHMGRYLVDRKSLIDI